MFVPLRMKFKDGIGRVFYGIDLGVRGEYVRIQDCVQV
jgi:hypothetical protein